MEFDEEYGVQVTAEASNFLDELFTFLRYAVVQRACDNFRAADHSPGYPAKIDKNDIEEAVWQCMEAYIERMYKVGRSNFRELPANVRLDLMRLGGTC